MNISHVPFCPFPYKVKINNPTQIISQGGQERVL